MEKGIDLSFRQPTTKRDITRRDLILFFTIRKLRYTMIASTNLPEVDNDLDLAYKSFLNNNLTHWEEGKFYEMGKLPLFHLMTIFIFTFIHFVN